MYSPVSQMKTAVRWGYRELTKTIDKHPPGKSTPSTIISANSAERIGESYSAVGRTLGSIGGPVSALFAANAVAGAVQYRTKVNQELRQIDHSIQTAQSSIATLRQQAAAEPGQAARQNSESYRYRLEQQVNDQHHQRGQYAHSKNIAMLSAGTAAATTAQTAFNMGVQYTTTAGAGLLTAAQVTGFVGGPLAAVATGVMGAKTAKMFDEASAQHKDNVRLMKERLNVSDVKPQPLSEEQARQMTPEDQYRQFLAKKSYQEGKFLNSSAAFGKGLTGISAALGAVTTTKAVLAGVAALTGATALLSNPVGWGILTGLGISLVVATAVPSLRTFMRDIPKHLRHLSYAKGDHLEIGRGLQLELGDKKREASEIGFQDRARCYRFIEQREKLRQDFLIDVVSRATEKKCRGLYPTSTDTVERKNKINGHLAGVQYVPASAMARTSGAFIKKLVESGNLADSKKAAKDTWAKENPNLTKETLAAWLRRSETREQQLAWMTDTLKLQLDYFTQKSEAMTSAEPGAARDQINLCRDQISACHNALLNIGADKEALKVCNENEWKQLTQHFINLQKGMLTPDEQERAASSDSKNDVYQKLAHFMLSELPQQYTTERNVLRNVETEVARHIAYADGQKNSAPMEASRGRVNDWVNDQANQISRSSSIVSSLSPSDISASISPSSSIADLPMAFSALSPEKASVALNHSFSSPEHLPMAFESPLKKSVSPLSTPPSTPLEKDSTRSFASISKESLSPLSTPPSTPTKAISSFSSNPGTPDQRIGSLKQLLNEHSLSSLATPISTSSPSSSTDSALKSPTSDISLHSSVKSFSADSADIWGSKDGGNSSRPSSRSSTPEKSVAPSVLFPSSPSSKLGTSEQAYQQQYARPASQISQTQQVHQTQQAHLQSPHPARQAATYSTPSQTTHQYRVTSSQTLSTPSRYAHSSPGSVQHSAASHSFNNRAESYKQTVASPATTKAASPAAISTGYATQSSVRPAQGFYPHISAQSSVQSVHKAPAANLVAYNLPRRTFQPTSMYSPVR